MFVALMFMSMVMIVLVFICRASGRSCVMVGHNAFLTDKAINGYLHDVSQKFLEEILLKIKRLKACVSDGLKKSWLFLRQVRFNQRFLLNHRRTLMFGGKRQIYGLKCSTSIRGGLNKRMGRAISPRPGVINIFTGRFHILTSSSPQSKLLSVGMTSR